MVVMREVTSLNVELVKNLMMIDSICPCMLDNRVFKLAMEDGVVVEVRH